MRVTKSLSFMSSLLFLVSGYVHSQELEPRTYLNFPIDQNVAIVALAYTEGDVSFGSSAPLDDGLLRL